MSKLDKYIIFIFSFTFLFTAVMCVTYWYRGGVPDELVRNFFVYIVGELLCCTIIKTIGDKFNGENK